MVKRNHNESGIAISGKSRTFKSVLITVLLLLILPIGLVFLLHNFVFQAYRVQGASMAPNLHESDYLIISKLGATKDKIAGIFGTENSYIPQRGDIIVFRFPRDTTRTFVKRVIALPGERVIIKNGKVTVYNKQNKSGFNPDSGYESKDTATLSYIDETVKKGCVFVLGDNRSPDGSSDSREWGDLPANYIIGTAELHLLPFDKAKTL
jgi:signal peptidase I